MSSETRSRILNQLQTVELLYQKGESNEVIDRTLDKILDRCYNCW